MLLVLLAKAIYAKTNASLSGQALLGLSVELGPVEWSWEVLVGFQNQGFGVIIVYSTDISTNRKSYPKCFLHEISLQTTA